MAKAEDYGALDFGAPGDAKNDTRPIQLTIGEHQYAVPRNYIELYDPRTATQRVVSLELYWPNFEPIRAEQRTHFRDDDFVEHLITIGLASSQQTTWVSVDQIIANLAKGGDVVSLKPGLFELDEVFGKSTPDARLSSREFIGDADGQKIWMRCQDRSLAPIPSAIALFCEFKLFYHDLVVGVRFGSRFMGDWKSIYRNTVAMLNSFKVN